MSETPRTARHYKTFALAMFSVSAILLMFPTTTSAHVKWFAAYDVTKAPKPFSLVADHAFWTLFALSAIFLYLGLLADGWTAARWPWIKAAGSASVIAHDKWVRLGTGAFLLCTWTIGLNILTPELHNTTKWVFTLQFISAICVAWRRTCVVAAVGLVVLYLYGIEQYGFFHMLDYVYFLGIALYLAGISVPRFENIRIAAITGSLAFSIMWTAIEKFVYPQWTAQVLLKHSHMAMGLPISFFTNVAGFVEFTLAFFLVTGRGLLRVGALVLLLVFITAMPEFGRLDVVGHLPLVAILGIPLMRGNTALQRFWRLPRRSVAVNAATTCLLYGLALSLFFFTYYGVQALEYPPRGI